MVQTKLSLILSALALGFLVTSCTCGPFGSPAPGYGKGSKSGGFGYAKGTKLYRPVNGSWQGHWTPDRAHAEDHLRAYNQQTRSSGGQIEVSTRPAPV